MSRLKLAKGPGEGLEVMGVSQKPEVRAALRQLLASLEPLIRSSGSSSHLHSMLTFLEDVDESAFNHLKLVQWVQGQLTRSVKTMVRDEVALLCRDTELTPMKMKIVAPTILHKVMQSGEIRQCLGDMRKLLQLVGDDMKGSFEQEFAKINLMVDEASMEGLGQDFNRTSLNRSVTSQDSFSSNWQQSNFIFLQPQEYHRLGEKLNRFSPTDVKLEALNTLLLTQLTDIVSSESWNLVKDGLQASLVDSNPSIAILSLKVHHRLLSNLSPFATKEAFNSVLNAIAWVYKDKTRYSSLPTSSSGLSSKRKFHLILLQVFKLLSNACSELPRFWSRYPVRIVHDIVDQVFHTIMMEPMALHGKKLIFHPIFILGVVDPQAKWLSHWLHSSFGRTISLRYMNPSFIRFVTETVQDNLEHYTVDQWSLIRNALARKSAITKKALSEAVVRYSNLMHCVNLISLIVKTQRGRQKSHQFESCLSRMILFVSVSNHIALKGPSKWIGQCLKRLASQKECHGYFLNRLALDRILAPIEAYIDDFDSKPRRTFHLALDTMVDIMTALIESARINLSSDVEAPTQCPFEMDLATVDKCSKFVSFVFQCHELHATTSLLTTLNLARAIGDRHIGCLVPSFEPMVVSLGWCIRLLLESPSVTPTNSLLNLKHHLEDEQPGLLVEILKDTLRKISQTPRGFFTVAKNASCADLFSPKVSRIAEHETLSFLALTQPGLKILCQSKFLEQRIVYLVEALSLEGDNKHWRPSQMETEDRMLRTIVLFVHLLSNLDFLKLAVPNGTRTKCGQNIRDIVLLRTTLFNNYSESESVFALKLFSCIAGGLDELLYLEHNFQIMEHINLELNMDERFIEETLDLIVDRETLYLSFLSHSLKAIGGQGERPLPKLSFEEKSDWRSSLNEPEAQIRVRRDAKAAETLLQFLAITKSRYHDREWLGQAKNIFGRLITTSMIEVKQALLSEILDQMQESWKVIPDDEASHLRDKLDPPTPGVEYPLGVYYMVKYGCTLDLFHTDSSVIHHEQLVAILNFASSQLGISTSERFDWFLGVAYLMMVQSDPVLDQDLGSTDKCQAFLTKISRSYIALFLWPAKARKFLHSRPAKAANEIEMFLSLFGHHIEAILTREAPMVATELRNEMISPALLCHQWWNQSLLNVLDWTEICHYHLLVILFGPDYVIYFYVALLRHLQDTILVGIENQHHAGRYLIEILKTDPIKEFRTGDYLPFMENLAKSYSSLILNDIKSFLNL